MVFDLSRIPESGIVSLAPIRIYTGMLGQIGDIVLFTPTARRLKQLFPNSQLTFAVSHKYRAAGELVAGLPYIDRLFVTEHYFEKLASELYPAWDLSWPVDLSGDDEIEEQRRHHIVFETRSKPRRMPWWEYGHIVSERAHMVGVPGPIDLQTDVCIPPGTPLYEVAVGKIVLHNDPAISALKAWSWSAVTEFVSLMGPDRFVLLGGTGPEVPGTLDLRGQTTLAEAANIIAHCACYIGIDSGLLWIASSLKVPTVGLFGTAYVPSYHAGYPVNPNALYIQAEGALERIATARVVEAVEQVLLGVRGVMFV